MSLSSSNIAGFNAMENDDETLESHESGVRLAPMA